MVGMAQLASAPDCGSGGQGFESLYPPSRAIAKRLRHRTLTPVTLVQIQLALFDNFINGRVAQVVEHLTFNQVVEGSSPSTLTKIDSLDFWCSEGLFFY